MKDMKFEIRVSQGVGKQLVPYPSIPVSRVDIVFPVPGRIGSNTFKISHFLHNFLGNVKFREYTIII
jgi:hypothetical protein